jgi:hypothetical protein
MLGMSGAFGIVLGLALASVLVALGLGIFSMTKGGAFNAKYGNLLMRARVIAQFAALALLVLAFLVHDG